MPSSKSRSRPQFVVYAGLPVSWVGITVAAGQVLLNALNDAHLQVQTATVPQPNQLFFPALT